MSHEDTDDELNITINTLSLILFSVINLIVLLLNISVCVMYYKKTNTKVAHCQTDIVPDHKIVVIHPNDELQLTAE